jgi:CHAT domain-containing protein/tetratricopeptide (TPR) repeat protein
MRFLILVLLSLALTCPAQSDYDKLNKLVDEGQYQEAIREIDDMLNTNKGNSFELNNRKALLNISIGDFLTAEKILNDLSATAGLTDTQQAITLSTRGFLLLNKGNFDSSLESLQKAVVLFTTAGKGDSSEAAQCLAYLGQLYFATGKMKQAEDNQLIALQIRQKLFTKDTPEIAASYNDLGLVYSQSDPDKALEYYEKALPIYKKIYGDNHSKVAVASTNIGAMYNKLELYGDAQNNFETALTIWKKLYPNGHPNQALVLMSLGSTYAMLKNVKATKAYFQNALSQYKKAYGGKHPDVASVYNQLGSLMLEENKFDSSLFYFQEALKANSISFSNSTITQNPSARSYYNGFVMLYSFLGKGQTLEEKYLNKTIKKSDLTLSLSCLQTADTLVDVLRQNSRDESDKIALGVLANEVYENGVRVAHLLSEVSAKPATYKEIAFYFAEKSKSAVLLESIADANAKSFAGIPQEMVEKEKSLKADIALHSQKLAQKPDAQQEQQIRKALFNLTGQYESFIKDLEKNFPEYFNLKYNNSSPGTKDVQLLLPEGTAVISYFIAEGGNRLYIFTLSRNKFKVVSRSMPEKFDRMVKGFNNSLFYSDPATYSQTAPLLSKLLDPKVGNSIKDLIIIPSGRLGTLPFEALPLGKITQSENFGNQFWVNRFSIGYEFSTTLMAQKTKKKSEANAIFLCAPIQFSQKQNLAALPGTEAEVNFIAGLFGKNALLKTAAEATETSVKQTSLKDYKYLHFATHGIVDEQSPELSRIFLKESDTDDGDLYSGEIYNLSLNADMVALSACQTGLGKVSKGEGVIGLSRALVYAGARNIMVSYWSVSDESTSQLMTGFYQNILQSSTPSYRKSLQQVKIKMIADKKYGAPFYWAPFVLIGF